MTTFNRFWIRISVEALRAPLCNRCMGWELILLFVRIRSVWTFHSFFFLHQSKIRKRSELTYRQINESPIVEDNCVNIGATSADRSHVFALFIQSARCRSDGRLCSLYEWNSQISPPSQHQILKFRCLRQLVQWYRHSGRQAGRQARPKLRAIQPCLDCRLAAIKILFPNRSLSAGAFGW